MANTINAGNSVNVKSYSSNADLSSNSFINNRGSSKVEEVSLTARTSTLDRVHVVEIPKDIKQTGIIPNITEFKELTNKDGWNHDSKQYELSLEWINSGSKSDRNIATLHGRYLVAVSNVFGDVGDHIAVQLENGKVIHCTIFDAKSPEDANATEYGHTFTLSSGEEAVDVIEWESMVNEEDKSQLDLSGWRGEKVLEIVNITKSNV